MDALCRHLDPAAYDGDEQILSVSVVQYVSGYAVQLLPFAACAAAAVLVNVAILPFAHNTGPCINGQ